MKYIAANWKMNGNVELANEFISELNKIKTENQIILCPQAALLYAFKDFQHGLGAQNCFYEEHGAFTGENSPKLLKEMGCSYVLVGHSERRTLFGESPEVVFKKFTAAVQQKLIPIVCIGEKLEERENWKDVLTEQLAKFSNFANDTQIIFAYEPLWSIGTGITPTVEEIKNVAEFLKHHLCKKIDYPILYGGSVSPENATDILKCQNVDGVLVGGASLHLDKFKKIIEASEK